MKNPYIFQPSIKFESECKNAHDAREKEIRAKFEEQTTTLTEHRKTNQQQHIDAKKDWDKHEAGRVKAHKEYMKEAGKLKSLIKQMEHKSSETTTLESVIEALTIVMKAMARIKTAFAHVKKYWYYVHKRSTLMIEKCGAISVNAKALEVGDDSGAWWDIDDAVDHIEESAGVWMGLCLQSWRAAGQIRNAEGNIDSFMENLGGNDDIQKQGANLLRVLDEEQQSETPVIKEIVDLECPDFVGQDAHVGPLEQIAEPQNREKAGTQTTEPTKPVQSAQEKYQQLTGKPPASASSPSSCQEMHSAGVPKTTVRGA